MCARMRDSARRVPHHADQVYSARSKFLFKKGVFVLFEEFRILLRRKMLGQARQGKVSERHARERKGGYRNGKGKAMWR